MRKLSLAAAACTAVFATPLMAAKAPVIIKIPRLTVEAAGKLAHAAMESCRSAEHGWASVR